MMLSNSPTKRLHISHTVTRVLQLSVSFISKDAIELSISKDVLRHLNKTVLLHFRISGRGICSEPYGLSIRLLFCISLGVL